MYIAVFAPDFCEILSGNNLQAETFLKYAWMGQIINA